MQKGLVNQHTGIMLPHGLITSESNEPISILREAGTLLSKQPSWKGDDGKEVSWREAREGCCYSCDMNEEDYELLLTFKDNGLFS